MNGKGYPKALQLYRLLYNDDTDRLLHACGKTHAYAMSLEYWPNDKITEVIQLDESWKN